MAESSSPFGPVLTVRSSGESLANLAQLPGVQLLELRRERAPANDLSRVTLGVSMGHFDAGQLPGPDRVQRDGQRQ